MTIFFAWAHKEEIFTPDHHLRHDMTLLSFDLSQKEGEVALLKLTATDFQYPAQVGCFLTYQETPASTPKVLFKGELCHFPIKSQKNVWEIECKACVEADVLTESSHEKGIRSDDFVELAGASGLTQTLHHQTALYEFDPVTGASVLCDIFEGMGDVWTPKTVFKESVAVRFTELPYAGIILNVKAEWVQKDTGEVDVWPVLAKAFPEKIVNSFTPKNFEKSFPKPGHKLGKRLGKSGCRVVESTLIAVRPPSTGVLNLYPRTSPPLWQKDVDDDAPRQVMFNRFWFDGVLSIEWQYKQRRREVIQCHVLNRVQAPNLRPFKQLTLTLKDLPVSTQSSVFKTPKGEEAIAFALDYARCFLAASARCVEVEFKVPFLDALTISTKTVVDLGNVLSVALDSVKGKVTSYRLCKKGTKSYAFIRCALALGMQPLHENLNDGYVEKNVIDDDVVGRPSSHQNLLDEIAQTLKPRGVVDTSVLHTTDIVESVRINNSGDDQVNRLIQDQYPRMGTLKESLKKHPTTFSIALRDLRNEPLLEEVVRVRDHYFSPKHMVSMKEVFYAA